MLIYLWNVRRHPAPLIEFQGEKLWYLCDSIIFTNSEVTMSIYIQGWRVGQVCVMLPTVTIQSQWLAPAVFSPDDWPLRRSVPMTVPSPRRAPPWPVYVVWLQQAPPGLSTSCDYDRPPWPISTTGHLCPRSSRPGTPLRLRLSLLICSLCSTGRGFHRQSWGTQLHRR